MMTIWKRAWHGSTPSMESILAGRHRERVDPRPGDEAYMHLLDLRSALADATRGAAGRWLDFGAGTCPYRDLLSPGAVLESAELAGAEGYRPDHELDAYGRCAVPDGTFDGVLSTQVLEHVSSPADYLREAHRVLRPGGRLLLSTHGVWEEHGGQDLWRWTADGLSLEAERVGFTVERCVKLTCGARALLMLLRRQGREHGWPEGGPVGVALRALGLLDRLWPTAVDRYLQRTTARRGVAVGPDEPFYLNLLLVAEKSGRDTSS